MELIHNTELKNGCLFFRFFEKFTNRSPTIKTNRKYVGMFGVFVKEIVIFNIGFGFVVLKSIW